MSYEETLKRRKAQSTDFARIIKSDATNNSNEDVCRLVRRIDLEKSLNFLLTDRVTRDRFDRAMSDMDARSGKSFSN